MRATTGCRRHDLASEALELAADAITPYRYGGEKQPPNIRTQVPYMIDPIEWIAFLFSVLVVGRGECPFSFGGSYSNRLMGPACRPVSSSKFYRCPSTISHHYTKVSTDCNRCPVTPGSTTCVRPYSLSYMPNDKTKHDTS